jgi:puromycin-sensitive aminopeptidase
LEDYFNTAQKLDALENSHPIEVEVRSSAQIEEIFDAISYNKGASVIRMISNLIGENSFRKGLTIYLNRHKYGNAVTEVSRHFFSSSALLLLFRTEVEM